MSASKDKAIVSMIVSRTSFMDEIGLSGIPLKIRCLALHAGYDAITYPRCQCGAPVTWRKATNDGFSDFCSAKCSRARNVLPPDVFSVLSDADAIRAMRFDRRMSIDAMASEIGCSAPTVEKWISRHGFDKIRYNESMPLAMAKLRDAEWMYRRHKVDGAKMDDIANEIGTSKSTVSLYMASHGIIANDPNGYDRGAASMSKQSMDVANFVRDLGFEVKLSDRKILGSREIDIVVESRRLCIEFNGLYSHVNRPELESEAARKGRNYHVDKTKRCAEFGYSLFHIFSDDWEQRRPIVESMLRSKLGVLSRIAARKCDVVSVDSADARRFLDDNHLQGAAPVGIAYGLVHDGRIVSVMTFSASRFNRAFDYELVRFASLLNFCVVGGFRRLLKAFRNSHPGSIVSYADKTHSSGAVYERNGFRHVKDNPPGYSYVDAKYAKRLHRYGFVKKRIAPNDPRPEWMIMEERGYRRLWDCGTRVYAMD